MTSTIHRIAQAAVVATSLLTGACVTNSNSFGEPSTATSDIGRWVPVDPTFQQFQLDAGHIQTHAGEKSGRSVDIFTPGLRVKVISSKRE